MNHLEQIIRLKPGCRERHLLRKLGNPLFPRSEQEFAAEDLESAQRQDDDELSEFLVRVKNLVNQVTQVSPESELDCIYQIVDLADNYYEQCAGLPGDQTPVKSALIRLITELTKLVMARNQDMEALEDLQQKQKDRLAHFTRLEHKLTGDLCRDHSPINEEDLIPTLLSESSEAVDAALELFDQQRIPIIHKGAVALISEKKSAGFDMTSAEQTLSVIDQRCRPV